VRIFNTYGSRMRLDDGRVVPNFLKQALNQEPLTIYGDGVQTRSFSYVDDLIEGVYRLLLCDALAVKNTAYPPDIHEPVNIGNPAEISVLELAQIINRLTGNPAGIIFKPDQRIASDPQRRQPDISRARNLLGWEPRIILEEGLMRTIAFFKCKMDAQ
jgi:dTDP-glucose 4,6-dehydratase